MFYQLASDFQMSRYSLQMSRSHFSWLCSTYVFNGSHEQVLRRPLASNLRHRDEQSTFGARVHEPSGVTIRVIHSPLAESSEVDARIVE